MWEREHVIWAAGLIEGEGCFTIRKRPDKNCTDLRITVGSTDEDVVRQLHTTLKLGHVTFRPARGTNKPCWVWQVGRRDHAYALCAALYPWLGQRRQARVRELMAGYTPPLRATHGTVTTYNYGCRCDVCRAASAKYRREFRRAS